MRNRVTGSRRDIALAVAILAFSALVYWQVLGLPPPRYEPMGSAALPKALSVIMAALAMLLLVRALWGRSSADAGDEAAAEKSATAPAGVVKRPWLAFATFCATAAYVAALDAKLLNYPLATIVYLGGTSLLLTRGDWRQWRWIAAFAVGMALACYFVFTRIFYIDLG